VQRRAQGRIAHDFGCVRKPLGQYPNHGQQLVGIDSEIEEALEVDGDTAVGPHEQRGVRVFDVRKSTGPQEAGQLVDVETRSGTDVPRREVRAVVADEPPGGQQHRRERRPDVLDADALVQQPGDQFGAFGTGVVRQTVEQTGFLAVPGFRVLRHPPNVYGRTRCHDRHCCMDCPPSQTRMPAC
jgi:hypothetical protein